MFYGDLPDYQWPSNCLQYYTTFATFKHYTYALDKNSSEWETCHFLGIAIPWTFNNINDDWQLCVCISNENLLIFVLPDGTQCEEGWIGFKDYCYKFNTTELPYEESVNQCILEGALLASINTAQIRQFLSDAFKRRLLT